MMMTDQSHRRSSEVKEISDERAKWAYRKRPVVIEAFCFDGGEMPDWFLDARSADKVRTFSEGTGNPFNDPVTHATIKTLEGEMRAERGDWIIRGVKGELYPCKPDIFAATYEPAALLAEAASQDEPDDACEGPICHGWEVSVADGHAGWGVYAHMSVYPEEGAVFLCAIPPASQDEEWVKEAERLVLEHGAAAFMQGTGRKDTAMPNREMTSRAALIAHLRAAPGTVPSAVQVEPPLSFAGAATTEQGKQSPVQRLHNICDALSEQMDGSAFSREEWGRIDAENAQLRARVKWLEPLAARYDWLRMRSPGRGNRWPHISIYPWHEDIDGPLPMLPVHDAAGYHPERLDAWIDEGRAGLGETSLVNAPSLQVQAQPAPTEGASQWRSIETAPKNGSYIWLADDNSARIAFWSAGAKWEHRGTVGGGWRDMATAEARGPDSLHFTPTHWMPVPRLPGAVAVSQEGQQGAQEARIEQPTHCPDGALPDGPTCPICRCARVPSSIGGGTWIHIRTIHPSYCTEGAINAE
jgi:hypothetical protein